MEKRYFKCWKCGAITYTENNEDPNCVCTAPMAVRTSGICGGSFSIEITKKEYEETLKEFKK